jgi:Putative pectate lyase-like adhesive domain
MIRRETVVRYIARSLVASVLVTSASAIAVGLGAAPAAAASAGTEAQLRSGWRSASTTMIDLTGNIVITDCAAGPVTRSGWVQPLTLNGHGHTIQATCPGLGVLNAMTATGGAITLDSVTLTGGTGQNNAAGIAASVPLVLRNSAVVGNRSPGTGGGIMSFVSVTLEGSRVVSNAGGVAGGVLAPQVKVVNSTVSGNSGIGVTSLAGFTESAAGGIGGNDIQLLNATIAGNVAAAPSADAQTGTNQVRYLSTLSSAGSVVNGPTNGANCRGGDELRNGSVVSGGGNNSSDTSCGFTRSSDHQGPAPR